MKPRALLFASALLAFPAYMEALTFSEWRTANFTSAQLADPTVSGATVDADGDGMANLHEYAFFGQPLTIDTTLAPTLEVVSGNLALTYRERHATTDVSIRLQGSDTLSNWITYNSVTEADRETFTDYDEVTLIDPQAFASNRRFLRLRAELLPVSEPRAPTQLTLKVVTPTTWAVGWSDPNTTETGYAVERRLTTNAWERLAIPGADTGGWTHTSANYQTAMTYRAVALGAGGAEAASAPITLPDTDGDGIPDALELKNSYSGQVGYYGSDPNQFSSNDSGVSDGWLASNGYDPAQPFDGDADSDGDGISGAEEAKRGTNPHSGDTDNDGLPDTIGTIWMHERYPRTGTKIYDGYSLKKSQAGGVCENGQIYSFGPTKQPISITNGSSPIIIGYNNNNTAGIWRGLKTESSWHQGNLSIWDENKQTEAVVYGLSAANDRLEIITGESIIRNGVIKRLEKLVETGWSDIYPQDINNHGIILAEGRSQLAKYKI